MSSVSQPLVSIIIPTYNREHILSGAIESAIKQTYPNKQIIVVDDGSVDKTRELVARYPQVEYVFQTNGRQGKARNTGLCHARGLYVASLDSDDTWNADFLERCIEKLEHENIGFAFANWLQVVNDEKSFDFFAQTKTLSKYISSFNKTWILLENAELRKIYLDTCPSPSSSFVFRRECMFGNWNEQLNIADDWCLLLDMILLKGCNAAFTTEKLWTKRTDGQNIYDGRNPIELIEHLGIRDNTAILERYKHNLKKSEIAIFNKRISRNIYEFYLHKLLKRKNTTRDNTLLKQALRSNPFLTGDVFLRIIYRMIRKVSKKIANNQ
ncbi:glycosyl transferase family 2 [Chitinophaga niastensis]|uniref:Glycosyl transferase family 2 n=1 Tax=Chitinophaga niastensis TaxID=536980 RepID=A0A2P8HEM9_CHINA|nr:glycosyltransferase family 2 protein [Chitinophaga niastensis]PSL44679.1 glycosyl transferase family 2 [Chitinophaga niastensis]